MKVAPNATRAPFKYVEVLAAQRGTGAGHPGRNQQPELAAKIERARELGIVHTTIEAARCGAWMLKVSSVVFGEGF